MHYQIKYGQTGQARSVSSSKIWIQYIAITLLSVGFLCALLWSAGMDLGVTVDALEQMAIDLGAGSDLKEAFSGFCLEILKGAECG